MCINNWIVYIKTLLLEIIISKKNHISINLQILFWINKHRVDSGFINVNFSFT